MNTHKLIENPIEHLMEAAKRHGEDSDPDHEVGDLQDMLRAMWELLPADKRSEFLAQDVVTVVLEASGLEGELRYIHGDWTHLFGSGRREDIVRLVFDREEKSIVAMQIADGPFEGDFVDATAAQIEDVQDSLMNANPDALESPADFGLSRSYEMPAWSQGLIHLDQSNDGLSPAYPRGESC